MNDFRALMMDGTLQTSGSITVPSSDVIATTLGRLVRYNGHVPCTVLAHSLIVGELCYLMTHDLNTWADGILHDVHEVITGDIVASLQRPALRSFQEMIDEKVRYAFSTPEVDRLDRARIVRRCDLAARDIEVDALASDAFRERWCQVESDESVISSELRDAVRRSDWSKFPATEYGTGFFSGILKRIATGDLSGACCLTQDYIYGRGEFRG